MREYHRHGRNAVVHLKMRSDVMSSLEFGLSLIIIVKILFKRSLMDVCIIHITISLSIKDIGLFSYSMILGNQVVMNSSTSL